MIPAFKIDLNKIWEKSYNRVCTSHCENGTIKMDKKIIEEIIYDFFSSAEKEIDLCIQHANVTDISPGELTHKILSNFFNNLIDAFIRNIESSNNYKNDYRAMLKKEYGNFGNLIDLENLKIKSFNCLDNLFELFKTIIMEIYDIKINNTDFNDTKNIQEYKDIFDPAKETKLLSKYEKEKFIKMKEEAVSYMCTRFFAIFKDSCKEFICCLYDEICLDKDIIAEYPFDLYCKIDNEYFDCIIPILVQTRKDIMFDLKYNFVPYLKSIDPRYYEFMFICKLTERTISYKPYNLSEEKCNAINNSFEKLVSKSYELINSNNFENLEDDLKEKYIQTYFLDEKFNIFNENGFDSYCKLHGSNSIPDDFFSELKTNYINLLSYLLKPYNNRYCPISLYEYRNLFDKYLLSEYDIYSIFTIPKKVKEIARHLTDINNSTI